MDQTNLRIAVPVTEGKLCPHFGHSEAFAVFEVEPAAGKVLSSSLVPAPEHEPGLLPRWLHDLGVRVVIAGGLGKRAAALLEERGVQVILGAAGDDPAGLVREYLDGALVAGANPCDH